MRLRETVRSLNELLARKNETINALNFSIQSLEEEIASLGLEQGAFEDLQALMVTLRADLEDRDTRIAELQLQWDALQTQLLEMERGAEIDADALVELTRRFDDAQARLVMLDALLIERDQTIITIMDQLALAEEEAAMAQARVRSLQTKREDLDDMVVELRQQVFALEGERSSWQGQRKAMTQEHEETLASLTAARITIDGLNREIGEHSQERTRLNQLLADLQQRLNIAFSDIERERGQHAMLLAQVERLQTDLAEKSAVIDGIMQQLSASEASRSALEAQTAALRLTQNGLRLEITERDDRIYRLQLDLEALQATLLEARLAVGDERIRNQRLIMQIEDARTSFISLLEICLAGEDLSALSEADFNDLGAAARTCLIDHGEMHSEYAALTARLEVALAERNAFEQKLEAQDPTYPVLQARLADVMAQLSDCSTARDNLDSELERLQRVVRENNTIIDAQRGQLGDQEDYIARLITGGADTADLAQLCTVR